MSRALVIIDLQRSFQELPNWAAISDPDIVKRANRLVEHARETADTVIWVLHTEPGTGTPFDPALGRVEIMEGVRPLDGEPIVTKTSVNAFTSTNLQQLLTQRGIRELTVCGLQTEVCCETTTRVGADLGYEMTFAVDATATFPIPHRNARPDRSLDEVLADPSTLPADEVIRRTEYAIAGRFAAIRTVDEVVGIV